MLYLIVRRESVCMADDFTDRSDLKICCKDCDLFSNYIGKIAEYIPAMSNSVWSIVVNKQVLGFLIGDNRGTYSYKLMASNLTAGELLGQVIHLNYYYENKFELRNINAPTLMERIVIYESNKENRFI